MFSFGLFTSHIPYIIFLVAYMALMLSDSTIFFKKKQEYKTELSSEYKIKTTNVFIYDDVVKERKSCSSEAINSKYFKKFHCFCEKITSPNGNYIGIINESLYKYCQFLPNPPPQFILFKI